MIYLKRFGLFLLIVIGVALFSILMVSLIKFINEVLGVWGLVGFVVILILILAIADVQLDKHLKRKSFDDLRKDSKYMFGGKDD